MSTPLSPVPLTEAWKSYPMRSLASVWKEEMTPPLSTFTFGLPKSSSRAMLPPSAIWIEPPAAVTDSALPASSNVPPSMTMTTETALPGSSCSIPPARMVTLAA